MNNKSHSSFNVIHQDIHQCIQAIGTIKLSNIFCSEKKISHFPKLQLCIINLIKVGKFIFPVDFMVIDMEEDKQVSLLLGRPFITTRAALIDVKKRELTLRVGDEKVHFYLNQSLK